MSAIKRDLEQSKAVRQQQARELQNQSDLLQQQQQAEVSQFVVIKSKVNHRYALPLSLLSRVCILLEYCVS